MLPTISGAQAIAKFLRSQFLARRNPEASLCLPCFKVGGECVCWIEKSKRGYKLICLRIQASDINEKKGWWGLRGGGANLPNLKGTVCILTAVKREMYPVWPEF